MRNTLKSNTGYGQFRWVVLLLLVVVILPTVCLLWFMNEAIDNERLVIRQKQMTFYRSELDEAVQNVDRDWSARCALLAVRTRRILTSSSSWPCARPATKRC